MPFPIAVVVDNVRSAHNVGSVLRTADSAGLTHVYLCGYTASPDHRGVQKVALGAEHAVGWSHHPDAAAVLEQLAADGWTLAALERTPQARPLAVVEARHFPLALVVGNEVEGVRSELLTRCGLVLALPQYGVKESLNVSVAFGVAAYGLVERCQPGAAFGVAGPGGPERPASEP